MRAECVMIARGTNDSHGSDEGCAGLRVIIILSQASGKMMSTKEIEVELEATRVLSGTIKRTAIH